MLRNLPSARLRLTLAGICAAVLLISAPVVSRAQETGEQLRSPSQQLQDQRAAYHKLQHDLLSQGARAKLHDARETAELRRRARRGDKLAIHALKVRRAIDDEGPNPLTIDPRERARGTSAPSGANRAGVFPTNVRANNPSGDANNAGQSEESVAALGNLVVVAWNDGQGFNTGGDVQGFGWSSDGGTTFTDGGNVPHPPAFPAWRWTSDPVMSVNEKTGEFWYCGLANPDASNNAIAVARGHFTAGVFAFDSVFIVRTVSNANFFLDKQWIACDSLTGNIYVSNTTFTTTGDLIDFYRSTNGGRTWSPPTTLSSALDDGWVQGSRPAVGPAGEVYMTWQGLEQSSLIDTDHFRFRKSIDGGLTFSPELNAADYVQNFGTGAPGFNRERGITFPSIAVDRTTGPHRGRVYMTWNESYDWLNDGFPTLSASIARFETDTATNNATNSSTATANPFTIGQVLRGTLAKTSNVLDLDYFSVTLSAGDRIIAWADSLTAARSFTMRLYAPTPDGGQRLCYGGRTDSTSTQTSAVWTFMAPVSGTYFLRMQQISSRTMTYRVRTTTGARTNGERGRDARDAFVTFSDNGSTWSTPSQVNDTPTGFDEYLPEIAVAADGMPYVMWFDERDDVYGSRTHVYMSRSADGGATWAANQRVTDAQSNFTLCPVNIAPNMGDYSNMTASSGSLYPVWADGRGFALAPPYNSVDVFSTTVPTTSSIASCPADTTMNATGSASFAWSLQNNNPLFSGLYGVTITSQRNWGITGPATITVGALSAASYPITVTVPDTAANGPNRICLTLTTPGGVVVGQCCFTITAVSGQLAVGNQLTGLALAPASPNPFAASTRINFSLPTTGHARLDVFSVTGARVRTLINGTRQAGISSVTWNGRDDGGRLVQAGAYFYRLEFEGRNITKRLVMMP